MLNVFYTFFYSISMRVGSFSARVMSFGKPEANHYVEGLTEVTAQRAHKINSWLSASFINLIMGGSQPAPGEPVSTC